MKAIELTSPSLDAFRATNLPDPKPARGEVLVRLRAASLNFIDVSIASGDYPIDAFPLIPVADGAGEVVALGEDVTSLAIGDRVVAHSKPEWLGGPVDARTSEIMRGISLPGSLVELITLRADAFVKTPAHLSDVAAATLPVAATTAWNAVSTSNVGPGSTVLLLGTGGVSIFALQFAKARGARVIITSSSNQRLQRAKALGADELVNYSENPEWHRVVLDRTNGRGADLVVETGGAKTFAKSLAAAAYGGHVFTIGFLSGGSASVDLFAIIKKALRVQGNNTGSVADLRAAVRAIDAAKIEPVVDRVFPVSEAAAAYRFLAKGGQHFGKVALTHDA